MWGFDSNGNEQKKMLFTTCVFKGLFRFNSARGDIGKQSLTQIKNMIPWGGGVPNHCQDQVAFLVCKDQPELTFTTGLHRERAYTYSGISCP